MKLIDADVLKHMITEGADKTPEGIQLIYIDCMQKIKQAVIECVKKIPDVEVVPKKHHEICLALAEQRNIAPVRHAHWVHLGGDEWSCSDCGEGIHTEGSWEKPMYNYCSNCGAKMDGGAER